MTPNLHCTSCAFVCTTAREGITHVTQNPTHTVLGEGREPGTTVIISVEKSKP